MNEEKMEQMCLDAVFNQKYKLTKILLDGGCSPDVCDVNGRSLLMICFATAGAKKMGWETTGYKILNLLIEFNADIDIEDCRGWTCLMYAYYYGAPMYSMSLLLDAGIARKDIDENGNTFSDIFAKRIDLPIIGSKPMNVSPTKNYARKEHKKNQCQIQPRQRCYSDTSEKLQRKRSKKVSFSLSDSSECLIDDQAPTFSSVPKSGHLPKIRTKSKTVPDMLPKKESYWVKVKAEFLFKKKVGREVCHHFECGGVVYTCTETITPTPVNPKKQPVDLSSLERLLSL